MPEHGDRVPSPAFRVPHDLKAKPRRADIRPMRPLGLWVIALLAGTSLLACGKTGVPVRAVSAATTLAQFDARANEICMTLTRQQEAIESGSDAPGKTGEAVWHEIVAVSRTADSEVKALPEPSAQASVIDPLVAAYFQEARDEEDLASAFGTGDADRVQTAYRTLLSLSQRDAAVARSLGMIACAKAEPETHAPERGRIA